MCFSVTASFTTAAVTGVVGIACLARVREPRNGPLAAVPLIFSLQQSVEAMLWLSLPSAQGASTDLALLFLFLAEVFWPIYAPIAVALIEPSKSRRRLVYLCLAVGVGVGAHLLWSILTQAQDVMILNGHITYMTKHEHTNVVVGAYLIATCLPLLVSSHRAVTAVGATVLIGYATAFIFYWQAFVSVWCFFAAAASILILLHFELERRQSLLTAGA